VVLAVLAAGCGKSPARPAAVPGVVWTRVTAAATAQPDFPDWRGDSIAFEIFDGTIHRLATALETGTGTAFHPTAAPTGDMSPRWLGPGVLVYSSDLSGTEDVWYLETASGSERRLTAFAGDELTPAPRPGSPGLAYVERTGTGSGRIVLLPDTAAVPLARYYLTAVTLNAAEPSWDPTGSTICFTAADAGGAAHIWKLSLSDTLAVQLTTGASTDRSPRFSPDGARILFASNRGRLWGVWSVSPAGEGTALGVLAYDAPGAEIRHPVWSPDGTRILLSSDRSGDRALWVLSNLGL
jgi:Tol biopolymer transport system component